MTALLVSVRDAAEARDAVAAGADLIDIKEPRAGSLGAAAPETIAEIVRAVAGRRPLSAALGELTDWAEKPPSDGERLPPGLQFAKLGLAGCANQPDWTTAWKQALDELPAPVSPVAVVYADWQQAQSPSPNEVILAGKHLGCRAMLIDTFDKQGPGLLRLWRIVELETFLAAARSADMLIVVGGQVTDGDIPSLLPLDPDYIAVRGAVCHGDRAAGLDPNRVRQLKKRLTDHAGSIA